MTYIVLTLFLLMSNGDTDVASTTFKDKDACSNKVDEIAFVMESGRFPQVVNWTATCTDTKVPISKQGDA